MYKKFHLVADKLLRQTVGYFKNWIYRGEYIFDL